MGERVPHVIATITVVTVDVTRSGTEERRPRGTDSALLGLSPALRCTRRLGLVVCSVYLIRVNLSAPFLSTLTTPPPPPSLIAAWLKLSSTITRWRSISDVRPFIKPPALTAN